MTHVSPQLPPRDAPNEKMVIDLYEQIDVLPPVRPMSGSVRTVIPIEMAQKLDSILMTVQNIDKGVKILSQPPRPPKSFQAPKPEVRNYPDLSVEFLELPPPRPPREKGPPTKDVTKKFSTAQCDFLVAQLRKVRTFVDDNFEDELVDKDDNMIALNTAIRAFCDV